MLTRTLFVPTAGQVTYRVVQVTQNEDGETQVVTASPFPPDTQVSHRHLLVVLHATLEFLIQILVRTVIN